VLGTWADGPRLFVRRRLWGLLLVVAATLAAPGCPSSAPTFENRKPTHPVSGQVLVNDKPAAGAFVLFIPVNEPAGSTDPRPRAEASEDGKFKIFTYDADDGAPAGEYLVTVTWPGSETSDQLGGRYSDQTKSLLKVTVKEGPNDLPPFKLR
jgi:hypothetical protein